MHSHRIIAHSGVTLLAALIAGASPAQSIPEGFSRQDMLRGAITPAQLVDALVENDAAISWTRRAARSGLHEVVVAVCAQCEGCSEDREDA